VKRSSAGSQTRFCKAAEVEKLACRARGGAGGLPQHDVRGGEPHNDSDIRLFEQPDGGALRPRVRQHRQAGVAARDPRLSDPLVRQEEPELRRASRKAYAETRGENAEEIRDYAPTSYLAGSTTSSTKLLTGFKAAPFVEPTVAGYDPTFIHPGNVAATHRYSRRA
jgi:hypothetical protein